MRICRVRKTLLLRTLQDSTNMLPLRADLSFADDRLLSSPTIPLLNSSSPGFHSFELSRAGRTDVEDGELHYDLVNAGATSSLSAAIANVSAHNITGSICI